MPGKFAEKLCPKVTLLPLTQKESSSLVYLVRVSIFVEICPRKRSARVPKRLVDTVDSRLTPMGSACSGQILFQGIRGGNLGKARSLNSSPHLKGECVFVGVQKPWEKFFSMASHTKTTAKKTFGIINVPDLFSA